MATSLTLNALTLPIFLAFFAVFVFLGFYGARWRKGNLNQLGDWALAGRRLGTWLVFFLVGADLYTAYTFVAIPSGVFGKGSFYAYAIPYVAITFGVALAFAPRLWTVSRENGYITGSDFVKGRFNSTTLSILVAITGIVALLPYIGLQIVGMQSVLAAMFAADGISGNVQEYALIAAFIILAAFTYTSGLRGATLTAVFKDILIWVGVISVILFALGAIGGNFAEAFAKAAAAKSTVNFVTVPSATVYGYETTVIGSALALYLYPHAINGVLSSQSAQKLRISTSMLCLYGLGLAFLALFGVLIYAFPNSLAFIKTFPAANQGIEVVPTLMINVLPGWLAGIALLGVFVGGLVPAAIMAIAQANLLSRNIIKEFKPSLTEKGEVRIAKWASAAFKFIALGFVFITPLTYSVQLQLLGGVIIIQLLPSLFLGLYTTWFKKEGLIVGLLAGLASGIYMALAANKYGTSAYSGLSTSLYSLYTNFPVLYIAVIALALNLVIAAAISAAIPRRVPTMPSQRAQKVTAAKP